MEDHNNKNTGHASKRARGFKGSKPATPAKAPVVHAKADPMAWSHALELSGGDTRRLVPQVDGSVMIYNNKQR